MPDNELNPQPTPESQPAKPVNGAQQAQPAPRPPKLEDAAQYFSWVGRSADPDKIETR